MLFLLLWFSLQTLYYQLRSWQLLRHFQQTPSLRFLDSIVNIQKSYFRSVRCACSVADDKNPQKGKAAARCECMGKNINNTTGEDILSSKMRFRPRRIVILLTGVSLFAWVAAKWLDQFNNDSPRNHNNHPRSNLGPFPDDKLHHIHWFVQVNYTHSYLVDRYTVIY